MYQVRERDTAGPRASRCMCPLFPAAGPGPAPGRGSTPLVLDDALLAPTDCADAAPISSAPKKIPARPAARRRCDRATRSPITHPSPCGVHTGDAADSPPADQQSPNERQVLQALARALDVADADATADSHLHDEPMDSPRFDMRRCSVTVQAGALQRRPSADAGGAAPEAAAVARRRRPSCPRLRRSTPFGNGAAAAVGG